MVYRKPDRRVLDAFNAACPNPPVRRRRMLGAPCAFLNGHLVLGVYRSLLYVRLNEADRAALLEHPDAKVFEPVPGHPNPEYVVVPRRWLEAPENITPWVERSLAYVATLGHKRL